MNIFKEANKVLDDFITNHLVSYHQLRNYDYGIEKRNNVSQISKYISHRILYEYEIIKKLNKYDKKKKFTDEILWRLYWKGYLENYKSIWNEYKNYNVQSNYSNMLKDATVGRTGIDCYNKWLEELRETNYLHNHSRIWFASIWIFTFKLPWQLGAEFFLKHLLDGDAASNTLSWRWVAGIHTNKKPYIASKENIDKYTVNRFKNTQINIPREIKIIKNNQHQSNKLPVQNNFPKSNILIMFDNDMNFINRSELFNSYSKVYILSNGVINNEVELSEKVIKFKQGLIDKINKLIPNSLVLKSKDIEALLYKYRCIDVIYPGIGYNLDMINKFANHNQTIINYIYREEDLKYWNYANSGYYKFKTSFYRLNSISNHINSY